MILRKERSGMNNAKGKRMLNFPLVVIGFVFLANPYIDMLDILPDFIGYLLVAFGLSAMAKLDDRLYLASQKLVYLAILSALRLICFARFASYDSSMTLLMTFSFGVAEVLLVLACFTDFFGGIEYLLQRYEGYDALSQLSNIKFLTLVFYITKIILCVLPNTVALLEVEAMTDISASPILNEIVGYKVYAVILFFLIVLILGIWWIREIYKYFKTIKKDKNFISSISEVYAKDFSVVKKSNNLNAFRLSFILTAIGMVFLFDIFVNKIDIFPDIVAIILIWEGVWLTNRQKAISISLPFVLALVFQAALAVLIKLYQNFDIASIYEFPVKNAAIMAAAVTVYAVFNIIFIKKAFDNLLNYAKKSDEVDKGLRKGYALYGLNMIFTAVSLIIPTLYTFMVLPRLIVMLFFIVTVIRRYYTVYDEYTQDI
ncbi:MAG: hypothetical protein ACOX3X_07255 [Eubacteriales bacterium]|jgi:hypothetical protein